MLKKKWLRVVGGIVLGGGSMVMAALYTWVGGSFGNWSDQTQWSTAACFPPCYPSSTNDDAVIDDCPTLTVTLTESLTIDDLTLGALCGGLPADQHFSTGGQAELTITADSITIIQGIITVEDFAGLFADGSDPTCP